MSYIKVLMPNGKEYGLKFNQGALIKMYDLIDKENFAGTSTYATVYAGMLMNAYIKKEELLDYETIDGKEVTKKLTYETVCDWVEELSDDVKIQILQCSQETTTFKKALEDSKKKLTETNSPQPSTDSNVIESQDV